MTSSQNLIDSDTIFRATNIQIDTAPYHGIGDLFAMHTEKILSYITAEEWLKPLENNDRVSGVLCTKDFVEKIPKRVDAIVCDDPTWSYFSLVDFLAKNQRHQPSIIDPASVTEGSWIAKTGVKIAPRVQLDHFVSVYESTTIAEDSLVRSGAVLGLNSFQHQRTKTGIISPSHDGRLEIGKRVEIGANCAISRGFSYRNTVIGNDVKIDAHVCIAHGVSIKDRTIVCAGVEILGHSTIGEDVFIGPGALIRNRVNIGNGARISIGSVVTQDVPDGETVTGNFAVPHKEWLAFIKSLGENSPAA